MELLMEMNNAWNERKSIEYNAKWEESANNIQFKI
jgi:hypothetical protein